MVSLAKKFHINTLVSMEEWLNRATNRHLKVKSLKFAAEAAITILRIDDSIKFYKANP